MSPHVPACAGFTSGTRSRRSRTWDHPRSRGVYLLKISAAPGFSGSSPLARGLRVGAARVALPAGIIPARAGFTAGKTGGRRPDVWIIPARAGFTWAPARWTLRRGDHPRSRGVYAITTLETAIDYGSSPLARGLRGFRRH